MEAKQSEFGKEVFLDLFRRLALQINDMLWVEHLEVMSYTRSNVGLRAYGQRDPLTEYRKEGTRLLREMKESILGRIADTLPKLQPQVVQKEEDELKSEAKAAQQSAGKTAESKNSATVVKTEAYGRNELVKITNGTETQELKYKKAEPLLEEGWQIVNQHKFKTIRKKPLPYW